MLTGCPGYLSLTINDRTAQEELFHYDLIIKCGAFELIFKVPNWGLQDEKTFDVVLDDGKKEHRIFLTWAAFSDSNIRSHSSEGYDMLSQSSQQDELPFLLIVVPASVVACLGLFTFFCHFHSKKGKRNRRGKQRYDTPLRSNFAIQDGRTQAQSCCQVLRSMKGSQILVVILYIAFKVVYSFFFTFSVFFTIVILCVHGNLLLLIGVGNIQADHYNQSLAIQDKIEQHVQMEVQRQMEQLQSMQRACDHYMDELFDTIKAEAETITSDSFTHHVMGDELSITALHKDRLAQLISNYETQVTTFIEEYQKDFNNTVLPSLQKYQWYLRDQVFNNDWFKSAQMFYNESLLMQSTDTLLDTSDPWWLLGPEMEFTHFLEVPEAFQIQLILVQLWERYINKLSQLQWSTS